MIPERLIDKIEEKRDGPCLIMIGGVHGNEASGVIALEKVMQELRSSQMKLRGNFYAFRGNLAALAKSKRFIHQDLNRLWNQETISQIEAGTFQAKTSEERELAELFAALQEIVNQQEGPFYFIDLHTTSAHTIPFLTVNDSLLNRSFTTHYPVPIILGIEEYIQGPLLSYINELGYVAFGYEAGQHDDPQAIQNQYNFIYTSLKITGILSSEFNGNQHEEALRANCKGVSGFFEIISRFGIQSEDSFEMNGQYQNFEKIHAKEHLANLNGQRVLAEENARIFMPLYQKQGTDGFFTVQNILPFFMHLSSRMRKWKIDHLLPLLPGISWYEKDKKALLVNRKVAKFLAKQIFHLLGYRSRVLDKTHWIMYNREKASRKADYKGAAWL